MADRVVVVVRRRGAVLVCGDEGTLPTAEGSERALLESLRLGDAAVERHREVDGWAVILVTLDEGTVEERERCAEADWRRPAALNDDDRRAYRAVAPTVETVAADVERGSSAIALDALWALRDAATEADGRLEPVAEAARELLAARPAMAALANRVNRAMYGATSPGDVARAATEAIERAHEADAAAAELAAETVGGGRVLTLSRSGTVRAALLRASPGVEVLASRPGGEGAAVAEELRAAGLDATVQPDAAVYDRLRSGAIDAALVGADAVAPDGGVINKVGTRAAALAAEAAGVPCYAACASDKVLPTGTTPALERGFDLTPPRLMTAALTERGLLDRDDVAAIAAEHADLVGWDA